MKLAAFLSSEESNEVYAVGLMLIIRKHVDLKFD